MSNLNEFLAVLESELLGLGRSELKETSEALVKDGQDFAEEAKEDIKEWAQKLLNREMSEAEFKLAVHGKADVVKVKALTQAGLAAIHIDKLKNGILDAVVAAATKAFRPGG